MASMDSLLRSRRGWPFLCFLLFWGVSAAPSSAQASKPPRPMAWVRGLAPRDALLRAGRPEAVVAVVKGLAASAGLTAELRLPSGVRCLESRHHRVADLEVGHVARLAWDIRAERPGRHELEVVLTGADGRVVHTARTTVRFEEARSVTPHAYVPKPRPVRTGRLVLAHYCPLWRYGGHAKGWDTIEAWPERRPALGFYDEGDPEVADWHIKFALEHGISGFIFTWDKIWLDPSVSNSLGAGVSAFLRARYVDRAKFCINWADQFYASNPKELRTRIFPYWLKTFFTHPSYVVIDGKPVLFITHPSHLERWMGGRAATRRCLDEMRQRCVEAGFAGLTVVGCEPTARANRLQALVETGYDASSAYILWADLRHRAGRDLEGIPTFSHAEAMAVHGEILAKRAKATLPDLVTVQMGWDSRPWHGAETPYYMAGTTVEQFREACRTARRIADGHPPGSLARRLVVIDNWNEFGEGHFIEPSAGYGFGFLDAVRDTFADAAPPCAHVDPRDIARPRPEQVFAACRGILHDPWRRARQVTDGLVAWWTFDRDGPRVAHDASSAGWRAFKHGTESVSGVLSRGLRFRDGGHAVLGVHSLLYPRSGVSVEMWVKTPDVHQPKAFLLNTAAQPRTGYGISLEAGHLAFYVNWTQCVRSPRPLPLGKWVHLAATSDNRTMALYVNGERVAAEPCGQRLVPAEEGVACLGAYAPGGCESFRGVLDEVKIHDRALTAVRIRAAARRR